MISIILGITLLLSVIVNIRLWKAVKILKIENNFRRKENDVLACKITKTDCNQISSQGEEDAKKTVLNDIKSGSVGLIRG